MVKKLEEYKDLDSLIAYKNKAHFVTVKEQIENGLFPFPTINAIEALVSNSKVFKIFLDNGHKFESMFAEPEKGFNWNIHSMARTLKHYIHVKEGHIDSNGKIIKDYNRESYVKAKDILNFMDILLEHNYFNSKHFSKNKKKIFEALNEVEYNYEDSISNEEKFKYYFFILEEKQKLKSKGANTGQSKKIKML